VPVKVNDNGTIYSTKMLAGSVGIQGSSSGQMLDEGSSHEGGFTMGYDDDGEEIWRDFVHTKPNEATGAPGLDSLQPVTGWFMYEVENEDDVEKRQQVLEEKKGELESIHSISGTSADERQRWHKLYREVEQLESF